MASKGITTGLKRITTGLIYYFLTSLAYYNA